MSRSPNSLPTKKCFAILSSPASVRIWRTDLLAKSFALQGYTRERMQNMFGAMLEAFDYGAPPHGGIALGIDRWAALLSDQTNIREVMAFPKTQSGTDLMLEAPSAPDPAQYAELGLAFVGGPKRAAGGGGASATNDGATADVAGAPAAPAGPPER